MFENVLKRLCPCYFKNKDVRDVSAYPPGKNKKSDVKRASSEKNSTDNTFNSTSSSTTNAQEVWKGTVNVIQPQPMYVLPADITKSVKKNQKNLLKPPLYWKKTMKNLLPEGPLVYQDSRPNNFSFPTKKHEKKKAPAMKHSETVADITSITSPSTVEVRWMKSQSLEDVSFQATSSSAKVEDSRNDMFSDKSKGDGPRIDKKKKGKSKSSPKDWNCKKCQVMPDISHGVIVLTAAYFNKKKICMINIDRLENLSKKGRERHSYYSVIKLAVLPSEKYIKCTKVLNNCSSPDVKQDFSFSVKELSGKVLRFSVFDASLQKQHEAVGHALLTLEDITCDQPKKFRIKLYRRTQPHVCPGNISLSMKYNSVEDKFSLVIDKARNLSLQKDKNVKLNTFVKVSLYSYGEKVKTKKSIMIGDSRDPNYNSTFTFQVRKDQIDHLSVTISVRLKGFVSDVTIGRLNFGPFFFIDDQQLTPWGRVFLKRETVSHWFRMYL